MNMTVPCYRGALAGFLVLFSLTALLPSSVAQAKSKHTSGISIHHSPATINRILEAAIHYCFDYWDPDYLHKPCSVWAEESGPAGSETARTLAHKLKSFGITLETGTWPNDSKRPKHYLDVGLDKIQWLTSRRVKIPASIETDYNDEVMTEGYGMLYLNYIQHRWIVDKSKSRFIVGE